MQPRRPGAVAAPDDATLALLFQRVVRCGPQSLSSSAVSSASESSLLGFSEVAGSINEEASRRTLAVTVKHALAQEVRETESVLHQGNYSSANSNSRPVNEPQSLDADDGQQQEDPETPLCRIPALQDLEELMNELYEVYDRSHGHSDDEEAEYEEQELSTQELQYARTLQQAVVMTLTQAALAKYSTSNVNNSNTTSNMKKDQDPLPLGEVCVWLLEMVVRPCALSRQLAFTLFLNLSISITSIALTAAPVAPLDDAMGRHCQANE